MAQENLTNTNPSSTITTQQKQQQQQQPIFIVHSPKTPISKLKSISLDKDNDIKKQLEEKGEELNRNVISMPNTPKHQLKEDNLKKCPSINSIVHTTTTTTTLKTLPEIKTIQDFKTTTRKSGGLLERRGSNASLTINLSNLNQTKSQSNLNLTINYECHCKSNKKLFERRKSQETTTTTTTTTTCNCVIYEQKTTTNTKKCTNCSMKYRRKSLSNENLYVPPCNTCCTSKGARRANYPKLLLQQQQQQHEFISDDFKLHLQNIQYLQTTTNLLTMNDLKQLLPTNKLHLEFWQVPLNLQEKCLISGSQLKNRYKGVLPNEHSRVQLNNGQDYIHANYIKGPDYTETAYIATQGPMAHTCEDFWEMVWSNNTTCIVMLTGLVEKGRNKCELYFPLGRKGGRTDDKEKSYFVVKTTKLNDKFTFDDVEEEIVKYEELNEIEFGKFKIKYVNEENKIEYTIRTFELINNNTNERRSIRHYWYANWKDHKMTNPQDLLQLAINVLNNHIYKDNNQHNISSTKQWKCLDKKKNAIKKEWKSLDKKKKFEEFLQNPICSNGNTISYKRKENKLNGPIVVHCSAGIGRTGSFLAILNGIQQLKTNRNVDVLGILCSLRLNRGGMVQTAEQYELIHRVLNLYLNQL